jgi:hypothetical protein
MEATIMKTKLDLSRILTLLTGLFMLCSTFGVAFADGTALVLRGNSEAFEQVVSGITGDLEGDLEFSEYIVGKGTSASDIDKLVVDNAPNIIVLIGNHSINAYTKYQKENAGKSFPPAVALAALYVDKLVKKLDNATGIRYEIPAVTSAVNLRSLLNKPLNRIGVIYRSWMKDFIKENAEYCKREGIELIGYEITGKSKKVYKNIKKGVKKLNKKNIDALWVVNDNGLLNKDALLKGWIPSLKKSKIPVVVGVKSLIQTKFKFGSYAIVPDHYALGVQGASAIAEIMDEDWDLDGRDIEQPISVNKLVNLAIFGAKDIGYKTEKLAEIDEVILN